MYTNTRDRIVGSNGSMRGTLLFMASDIFLTSMTGVTLMTNIVIILISDDVAFSTSVRYSLGISVAFLILSILMLTIPKLKSVTMKDILIRIYNILSNILKSIGWFLKKLYFLSIQVSAKILVLSVDLQDSISSIVLFITICILLNETHNKTLLNLSNWFLRLLNTISSQIFLYITENKIHMSTSFNTVAFTHPGGSAAVAIWTGPDAIPSEIVIPAWAIRVIIFSFLSQLLFVSLNVIAVKKFEPGKFFKGFFDLVNIKEKEKTKKKYESWKGSWKEREIILNLYSLFVISFILLEHVGIWMFVCGIIILNKGN